MATNASIRRLTGEHAGAIVACFRRVYGDSYANPDFYDAEILATAIAAGQVKCVGALNDHGDVIAHMAMTVLPNANVVELGNTIVDVSARGSGLAWEVGAALADWAREIGSVGFLHYPTTAHHLVQHYSVERGFETGVMLGYTPPQDSAVDKNIAVTIAYEPLSTPEPVANYLPQAYRQILSALNEVGGLPRQWKVGAGALRPSTVSEWTTFVSRRLRRLSISAIGEDIGEHLSRLAPDKGHMLQVDLPLNDPGIDIAVEAARAGGFVFCGWLPGFAGYDVLRMQRIDQRVAELSPNVVNETAQWLLRQIHGEIESRAG